MVEIPDLGETFLDMWRELMQLEEHAPAPWTLIGAHMVAVHGWARNRAAPRTSRDADILVNVRMVSDGTEKISRRLQARGFALDGVSPEGIGHRFVKKNVRFDVLGPDGAGKHARFTTVAGARTVAVPEGTQALNRSEKLVVRAGTNVGRIPVPSILGSLLVKIRAVEVDDQPKAQREDVAFLLSLIDDPDPLAHEMSSQERQWLRRHPEFIDHESEVYRGIANASDAATVFRRLARQG
jgi:hypothetical protein